MGNTRRGSHRALITEGRIVLSQQSAGKTSQQVSFTEYVTKATDSELH